MKPATMTVEGGDDRGATCPECGRLLASYIAVDRPVHIPVPEVDDTLVEDVPAGYRVVLGEDFTNAGARHRSGLPWYHRGRSRARKPRSIRVPAVVTCCGTDLSLDSLVEDEHRDAATAPADERRRRWEAEQSDAELRLIEDGLPE